MSRFYQVHISGLPLAWSGDGECSWPHSEPAKVFSVLRDICQINSGRHVKVFDITVEDGPGGTGNMHGRDVSEDIAYELADADLRDHSIDQGSDVRDIFTDFCLCHAGDYCEDILADAKAEDRVAA
jgi:hypothetical protein